MPIKPLKAEYTKTGGNVIITWPNAKGTPEWLKVYEVTRLKDLKPKIRKEVQKLLDKQGSDLVEYTPISETCRGVTPHFWKEDVSNHVVPRGAAPNDYEPPTIVYRGNPEKFRDEVQKAYDNHPDPAFRGKVDFTNT